MKIPKEIRLKCGEGSFLNEMPIQRASALAQPPLLVEIIANYFLRSFNSTLCQAGTTLGEMGPNIDTLEF